MVENRFDQVTKTINLFEHVSVPNSQSVLRNDVTSYALERRRV